MQNNFSNNFVISKSNSYWISITILWNGHQDSISGSSPLTCTFDENAKQKCAHIGPTVDQSQTYYNLLHPSGSKLFQTLALLQNPKMSDIQIDRETTVAEQTVPTDKVVMRIRGKTLLLHSKFQIINNIAFYFIIV